MWKDLGAGEEKMTKIYCRKTLLNYGIKIKNVTQCESKYNIIITRKFLYTFII